MKSKIDIACDWAVGVANNPEHGYDNVNRTGPDYDCVSLVVFAWEQAGVYIEAPGSASFGHFATQAGFIEVTSIVDLITGAGLRRGDILYVDGRHVAMIVDEQYNIVEAYSNENGEATGGIPGDQTGREILVNVWRNEPAWTNVYRWPSLSADKSSVISANRYLTQAEMRANAIYIAAYLLDQGWTLQAISGMLGNMQHESSINPGIWQNLDEGNLSMGYGLVQWTPATNLINWAENEGLEPSDIDTQIMRILYEKENGSQYYATEGYNLSFTEFAQSTEEPYYLACAFAWNYERSWVVLYGSEEEKEALRQQRGGSALEWFTYLSGVDLPSLPKTKGMKKLMLYAMAIEGW